MSKINFRYTQAFNNEWQKLGLSELDKVSLRLQFINYLKNTPDNNYGRSFPGDMIPHTGGAIKMRFSANIVNHGKSGGYRIIYFMPFNDELLFFKVYSKHSQETLSDFEKNTMKSFIRRYKGAH